MKTPIPIFLIGPENWEASHVFNPNAFPVHVRNLVLSCMDCLSMFIFSVNQVEPNIERDRKQFLSKLRKNKAFYGFTPDPDKPCVVVYHNAKFLVAFNQGVAGSSPVRLRFKARGLAAAINRLRPLLA